MGRRKKSKAGKSEMMMTIPVPDERPNWPSWDRHDVMMSVSMEYKPNNFENEYLAVICPVAKRRIIVSHEGWTCSYNKLLNLDRKFQSTLPGGHVSSMEYMRNPDMCILDCLHLKQERTFYMLDLMYWRQLPYYNSEAEFRFHWINQMEQEFNFIDTHPENEYKFRSMPRFNCTPERLFNAMRDAPFKVDGILFFHRSGFYQPGVSPNVLWLPPDQIELVLGWKPPQPVSVPKPIAPKEPGPAGSAEQEEEAKASENVMGGNQENTPLQFGDSTENGTENGAS